MSTSLDNSDTQEVTKASRRTWFIALLVVLLGAACSAFFVYFAIASAQTAQEDQFDRHATDLCNKIESSFKDYETAAAWIHETCRNWRNQDFTREDFRVLYDYITYDGLDFFLAEWVPNITHAERADLEAESEAFYANDTNVNYRGILGLGPNPENPEEVGLFPRINQPYYFPIQYLEPYDNIGDAVHLDLYSLPYEQEAIDLAIETFQPTLTERFEIESQETDGYSVSLMHPGVRVLLSDGNYTEPKDLALLLIHIRSLLKRAAKSQADNKAVYLYDCGPGKCHNSTMDYLGGTEIMAVDSGEPKLTYYDSEVIIEDILEGAYMNFTMDIEVGQRNWRIVVVSVDNTYKPNNATAIIGGVVIFAASLLLAWIWIIHNKKREKHVHHIMNKAAAESAIVTSLFPSDVRDRLIKHNRAEKKPIDPAENVLDIERPMPQTDTIYDDGMPIADEYTNTTVLFADMAGFTSWSSKREPQTVFKLLESLYGAFDVIAKKRKVFKVETIGDCYLAVTGIPNPQPNHAIIMTVFARQCMLKMREIVHDLQSELGEDTLDLQMRVGLHSGPVTAGVLRGEKARFQLFGDTVNTASRMESNGSKGRIHCSQATADALIVGGKGHWLTAREEKIMVKGKGEMQTYWILGSDGTKTSTTYSSMSSNKSLEGFDECPDDLQQIKNAILEARQRQRAIKGVTQTSAELRKEANILNSDNVEDLILELQERRSSMFKKNDTVPI